MATKLTDDREKALEIGFAATDWSTPVSFDQYKNVLANWTVKAIVRDDTYIGAVYFKDGEVHVSILPDWRKKWATRGLLDLIFADKNAFTRIMPGHEYMYGIFHRLGFTVRDDGTVARER